MKAMPLNDRVVIQVLTPEKQTASGIIIPDCATEKPEMGTVLSVGKGKKSKDGFMVPLEVLPGDLVLFSKGAGEKVRVDSQDYLVIKEADLIGIVEK